ncbi:hypothetical protein Drose_04435 [Dactylosporangium roseum]|uniref:Lipoprotein n=1 Tax=Dactylosporangium roseum TaxID=47989 RepID=A0ABY5Z7T0_9ACTN|nr:hypothetical protein [Dactylosporangium roseum]UWZ37537.1 hypothetical protein Drose_04435 [Dactylosporangium roseum]
MKELLIGACFVLAGCAAAVVGIFSRSTRSEPYPAAAAEPPPPLGAGDCAEQRIVAASDLDLTPARVNLLFALQVMPYTQDAKDYEAEVLRLYGIPDGPP